MFRREKDKSIIKPKTSVLDRGEIESSDGMKWRVKDQLIDLVWSTSSEPDNLGFIIDKRPSFSTANDFQEIASYKEVSQLASKGVNGGRYRYIDPSTGSGSWIYRVRECDKTTGLNNVLCQCFVEVESAGESKFQAVSQLC